MSLGIKTLYNALYDDSVSGHFEAYSHLQAKSDNLLTNTADS